MDQHTDLHHAVRAENTYSEWRQHVMSGHCWRCVVEASGPCPVERDLWAAHLAAKAVTS